MRRTLPTAVVAVAAGAVIVVLALGVFAGTAPGGPGPGGAASLAGAERAAPAAPGEGAGDARSAGPTSPVAAASEALGPDAGGGVGAGAPAAPPARVAGADGTLVDAPAGLSGRAATKRGSPAVVAWERVPVFGRATELGRLGRPVARGLDGARERLRPCYAEERRALAAGRGPVFDPADPPAGPAILVLDLETRAGSVEIVSANVDSLGTSTAELATCAVERLTGYAIDAPAAATGQRFRLLHLLR